MLIRGLNHFRPYFVGRRQTGFKLRAAMSSLFCWLHLRTGSVRRSQGIGGHPVRAKSLLKFFPATLSVDQAKLIDRCDRIVLIVKVLVQIVERLSILR